MVENELNYVDSIKEINEEIETIYCRKKEVIIITENKKYYMKNFNKRKLET